MDNFMDKLAQRFNSQEIIKANSQAEARELERLREQTESYDTCVQEMRKLNLKNVEISEQMKQVVEAAFEKLDAVQTAGMDTKELAGMLNALREALKTDMEQISGVQEELKADVQQLSGRFESMEEFVHKENVKVYRNVQAVLLEELKNQTKELAESMEEGKKSKGLTIMVAVNLVLGLANLALLIVHAFLI